MAASIFIRENESTLRGEFGWLVMRLGECEWITQLLRKVSLEELSQIAWHPTLRWRKRK